MTRRWASSTVSPAPACTTTVSPGSPVLVVDALLGHDYFSRWTDTEFIFLFNEVDPDRYASLAKVVEGLTTRWSPWPKNVKVRSENRAFSELAEEMLAGVKGLIPLFAFIDPFGYRDIPMDLIRRMLQHDKAELFIFDFNSVNRFAGKGGRSPVRGAVRL